MSIEISNETPMRLFIRQIVKEELEIIVKTEFSNMSITKPEIIIPLEKPQFDSTDLVATVSNILKGLGIQPNLKGYGYMRSALLLGYTEPHIIENITKELYPIVSKEYNTTGTRVERAIRHAIELSWNGNNVDTIKKFFHRPLGISHKTKPTNKEYLSTIMDKLRLEMKLNNEVI